MVDVLDKGRLELVDSMGSDLSVVQAARISNGAAMPEWRGAPDEKLINFLAINQHMTPFEHATFKFYVKAPLFVVREWQRHRTFSYNERSGRYKKFESEFYTPEHARVQDPNNKQSSIIANDPRLDYDLKVFVQTAHNNAFAIYNELLDIGIARELARIILPLNLYTEFYATGNFRNWMHFIELRNTPEAQYEIRMYAAAIRDILYEHMPQSVSALEKVR